MELQKFVKNRQMGEGGTCVINLLNYLCDHLSKLFAVEHKEWFFIHKINYSQDQVYDEFEKHILGLLEKRDIKISDMINPTIFEFMIVFLFQQQLQI